MPVILSTSLGVYRRCSAHKESLYLYAKKTMVDVAKLVTLKRDKHRVFYTEAWAKRSKDETNHITYALRLIPAEHCPLTRWRICGR